MLLGSEVVVASECELERGPCLNSSHLGGLTATTLTGLHSTFTGRLAGAGFVRYRLALESRTGDADAKSTFFYNSTAALCGPDTTGTMGSVGGGVPSYRASLERTAWPRGQMQPTTSYISNCSTEVHGPTASSWYFGETHPGAATETSPSSLLDRAATQASWTGSAGGRPSPPSASRWEALKSPRNNDADPYSSFQSIGLKQEQTAATASPGFSATGTVPINYTKFGTTIDSSSSSLTPRNVEPGASSYWNSASAPPSAPPPSVYFGGPSAGGTHQNWRTHQPPPVLSQSINPTAPEPPETDADRRRREQEKASIEAEKAAIEAEKARLQEKQRLLEETEERLRRSQAEVDAQRQRELEEREKQANEEKRKARDLQKHASLQLERARQKEEELKAKEAQMQTQLTNPSKASKNESTSVASQQPKRKQQEKSVWGAPPSAASMRPLLPPPTISTKQVATMKNAQPTSKQQDDHIHNATSSSTAANALQGSSDSARRPTAAAPFTSTSFAPPSRKPIPNQPPTGSPQHEDELLSSYETDEEGDKDLARGAPVAPARGNAGGQQKVSKSSAPDELTARKPPSSHPPVAQPVQHPKQAAARGTAASRFPVAAGLDEGDSGTEEGETPAGATSSRGGSKATFAAPSAPPPPPPQATRFVKPKVMASSFGDKDEDPAARTRDTPSEAALAARAAAAKKKKKGEKVLDPLAPAAALTKSVKGLDQAISTGGTSADRRRYAHIVDSARYVPEQATSYNYDSTTAGGDEGGTWSGKASSAWAETNNAVTSISTKITPGKPLTQAAASSAGGKKAQAKVANPAMSTASRNPIPVSSGPGLSVWDNPGTSAAAKARSATACTTTAKSVITSTTATSSTAAAPKIKGSAPAPAQKGTSTTTAPPSRPVPQSKGGAAVETSKVALSTSDLHMMASSDNDTDTQGSSAPQGLSAKEQEDALLREFLTTDPWFVETEKEKKKLEKKLRDIMKLVEMKSKGQKLQGNQEQKLAERARVEHELHTATESLRTMEDDMRQQQRAALEAEEKRETREVTDIVEKSELSARQKARQRQKKAKEAGGR
ncbi:unnamed protein product [Amoebophrya sp. A25]|nr:unnamed protein product [Amoebophrya sp. A25]|eukprot:GSA25T00007621001.1